MSKIQAMQMQRMWCIKRNAYMDFTHSTNLITTQENINGIGMTFPFNYNALLPHG